MPQATNFTYVVQMYAFGSKWKLIAKMKNDGLCYHKLHFFCFNSKSVPLKSITIYVTNLAIYYDYMEVHLAFVHVFYASGILIHPIGEI